MTEQEALYSISKLKEEKERLEAENQELNARVRLLHSHLDEQKTDAQRQYTQGLIDALVFAVRCNSVNGNEVVWCGRRGT